MELVNLCCCCLMRQPNRYMNTMYNRSGVSEVFSDMLGECFQIYLSQDIDSESGICEQCVFRLRDALAFKLQVQQSQAELRARLRALPAPAELLVQSEKWYEKEDILLEEEGVRPTVKREPSDDVIFVAEFTSFSPNLKEPDSSFSPDAMAQLSTPCCVRLEHLRDECLQSLATCNQATTETTHDSVNNYKDLVKDVSHLKEPVVKRETVNYQTATTETRHLGTEYGYNEDLIRKDVTQFITVLTRGTFDQTAIEQIHDLDTEYADKENFRKLDDTHIKPFVKEIFDNYAATKRAGDLETEKYVSNQALSNASLIHLKKPVGTIHTKGVDDLDSETYAYKQLTKKSNTTHLSKTCPNDIWLKQFSSEDLRKQYKLSNTGDEQFSCELCNKQFTRKINLDVHKQIHTGDKPFVCKICTKRFTQKGNLKTHYRVHTDEKPYICNVCSRKFRQLSQLQNHERIHSGDRPFVCEVCRQRFRQKANLQVHRRVHAGEWLPSVKYVSSRLNITV